MTETPPSRAESAFLDYYNAHLPEVVEVQKLLLRPLSDVHTTLQEQLRETEAWYGRLTTMVAWADYHLDMGESSAMKPKEGKETELDRQKALAAEVATQRRFRDVVQGLADSIRQRVMLGMGLLKAQSQEGARTGP